GLAAERQLGRRQRGHLVRGRAHVRCGRLAQGRRSHSRRRESRRPVTAAIETIALRKEYGRKIALHGLDLTVQPGEVFGFLGPNGAGKTTTVKILLGLVRSTSGQAHLFGRPAGDAEARQRIGYLPENFRFHDWLSGAALLDFHARLAGVSATERRRRIPKTLELVGLSGRGDDR